MGKRRYRALGRGLAASLAVVMGLMVLALGAQTVWAHRQPEFQPEGQQVELRHVLERESLRREDYDLIFRQTGLSQAAVDDLLSRGEAGVEQILETQEGFFAHYERTCVELIGGRFTCEDKLLDEAGQPIRAVPLAPLEPGDLLVTFSTHSLGWRHGHAGLITDPDSGRVLEALQLGADSKEAKLDRWRSYSNLLVLRVKDAVDQMKRQVVRFAQEHLTGVPYSLLAGLTGSKVETDETMKVQCAYLPWLAWEQAGVDLDSDGGQVVTVRDLAESPLVEVVQVYGLEPELVADRQCRS